MTINPTHRSERPTRTPRTPHTADTVAAPDETVLRRAGLRELRDLIEQARPMPLSTSVMINQAEVLDLINEATERLPEELRSA